MANCALLEADPELAYGLRPDERAAASRALIVPVLRLRAGAWDLRPLRRSATGLFCALLLEGRLQRAIQVGDRSALHLFGPGDVVRPWDDDDLGMPGLECVWSAIEATELALLDRRFAAVAGRWPALLCEVARRIQAQSARIQLQAAYGQMTRVDDRILLLFWRMGQRWGRMTLDGVLVPVGLTHAQIAASVGARRPPVSTALGRLSRERRLWRTDDGWMLARGAEAAIAEALGVDDPQPVAAGHGAER